MSIKSSTKTFSFSRDLLIFAVILFIVEFVRGAYLISFLPNYAVEHLGYSVSFIGLIISVHYFSDTVVKIFVGYLLDRFSLRLIMQTGLLIAFVGLWTMYYIPSPWALVVSTAIFGIGVSPIWIICLSNVKEENRAEQMGLLYALWLSGLGLGPVVINFLIDISYNISFWLIAFLWLIGGVLSFWVNSSMKVAFTSLPVKNQIKMFWSRLRTMGPLFPGMILQTLAASMLIPILPDFASNHLGLSHTDYSYIMIAGGVSAIIFLIPMGKLSDRFGGKWFMISGFGIFALTLYSLTLVSSFNTIFGLAILLGLSYAAVLPAWNAFLAHFIPKEQKGIGWGLISSLEGVGIILGPVIGGWLAVRFSNSLTILISGLLFFIIALFYLLFSNASFRGENRN
jgi:MFS family permease